ncbi:hypothetical protein [Vibrio alginolyticus]|uniref:hypothetical protein n=1 Tax=Vibrio alginolyticus TaxID=663 RepID=UPI00104E3F54|nr:hypothetical protein [Vibrio alginolyticus]TDE49422.1 hypothetical protein E1093_09350 [Vibrio alginolyticus]
MKVLIISGVGWNENYQRQQKIATEICNLGHEVDYMQGFVTSKFKFSKFKSYINKVFINQPKTKITKIQNEKPKELSINSIFTLPSTNIVFDLINSSLVKKKSQHYDFVISYLPVKSVHHYISSLPNNPYVIYDCVRNFPEWPGYPSDMIKQEKEFIDIVDDIWVDSFWLKDKFENYGFNPKQLLPTIDLSVFNKTKQSVSKIKKIVYYGLISHKIDLEAIKILLDSDYDITFIGPKESNVVLDERIRHIPQSSQKDIVKHVYENADALIIPYVSSGMDGVIPAKTIECLSFGIPTFLSSFFDSQKLNDYFYVYRDSNELKNMIKNFDKNEFDARRLRSLAFVRENDKGSLVKFIEKNINV